MKVICEVCGEQFVLKDQKREFAQKAINKKMKLIMLECDLCKHTFPVNPLDLGSKYRNENPDIVLRCPIKGCDGWVTQVDDFFGCGECGTIWTSEEELIRSIKNIIKLYPYRAKFYDFNTQSVLPVDVNIIGSQAYIDLIDKEVDY